ncbi:M48 family metalloprotease [Paracraurococcus lichenis]|uniref:M48 family metalloprotease n=1 Tax=Paracraurococcus lichenis TaxID=3064888 RepID=A0ABT9DV87_9PROT|nr:M48 family metalloprotease [Paracraurococcus sp. LOR1-02]MDO9707809.1 M48 family metalloprotease [Paracraurococcus sp. LOR1-02]
MSITAAAAAERTTFHAEQARRRRGAWLWGLLCLALAAGIGAVLSTITGPLLLLLLALALKALAWLGLAPGAMLRALHGLEGWVAGNLREVFRGLDLLDAVHGPAGLLAALGTMATGAALLLPGMAAAVLVWASLARTYRRSAILAATADLGAREPRPQDPEERQLGNILAEVSLAAGLATPRLLLLDAPQPNAAAFGASHREAAVMATRGLLDRLDRRETQGVVAHLVAAIGDGDLRLAASVQAVFGTLGAMVLVFDLPFRRGAWAALRDLLLAIAGLLPPERAERLKAGLAACTAPESLEGMTRALSLGERWPPLGALLVMPLLPWTFITLAQKMLVWLWTLFVFGWPLGLLWRTRRYLADAGAVRLLRDPEALAGALRRIDADGLPPGGASQELGFFHAPQQAEKAGFRAQASIVTSVTPPIGKRLWRLSALGAGAAPPQGWRATWQGLMRVPGWKRWLLVFLLALLVPLLALLVLCVGTLMVGASLFSLAGGASLAALILSL